ncbi:uncharacterized protein LOC126892254 isoform X5 [Diabrotica virgifera virgifera]|uniref:Uncharacterized protein n=1 Tax=Diabrotica virgifera virgifera TaxID=50390 RepID=A0ABM5L5J6_DIAVI|nr:uncharacterized protein LOC126892254 isoform X5 [Diabrotica virgifera virgifera]
MNNMERKQENEDTVKNIKVENSIVVKPEYVGPHVQDYGHGGWDIHLDQIKTEISVEDMTFEQNQDDLEQFQHLNRDVDNIKLEHTAKGSQSSERDSFKNEIKEESDTESIHDTLDDSGLNEYSSKIEIDETKLMPYGEQTHKEDSFKKEIKDKFDREGICETFDDLGLNEYSLKIEIEDEKKLMPYGGEQTHKEDCPQEKDTCEITKTIDIHSSHKEQHTSLTDEEKTLICQICGNLFKEVI